MRLLGRLEAGLCAAASLAALLLHTLLCLRAGPLWRDEIHTLNIATSSARELWSLLGVDHFPALYPALIKLWLLPWSDAEIGLRALGLLVGLGCLAALFWAARRLGSGPPVFSLCLFATNLVVLRWGDSTRAHGLSALLAALAAAAFWRLALEPTRRARLQAFAAAFFLVQCSYLNALFVLAFCAAAAAARDPKRRLRSSADLALIGAGAALSLLPYLPALSTIRGWNMLSASPKPAPGTVSTAWAFAGSPTPALRWLWLAAIGLGGWACLMRPGGKPAPDRASLRRFLATALTVSALGYIAVFSASGVPPNFRYLIPLAALCALCLDAAVGSCAAARPRAVRLALGAAALALAFGPSWRGVQRRRTNADLAARLLEREAGPQDLIIVQPWSFGISFARHYRGATPWETMPAFSDYRVHRYDLLKRSLREGGVAEPVLARVSERLAAGGRVWLVGEPPPAEGPDSPPRAPHPDWGWNQDEYTRAWGSQVLRRLWAEGEIAALPPLFNGPVNTYEDFRVLVARARPAATSPRRPGSRAPRR